MKEIKKKDKEKSVKNKAFYNVYGIAYNELVATKL